MRKQRRINLLAFITIMFITVVLLFVACTTQTPTSSPVPAPATTSAPVPTTAPASTPAATQLITPSVKPTPTQAASVVPTLANLRLLVGTTATTSGNYAREAATATVMSKYAPGIQATPVEAGASVEGMMRLQKGELDITTGTGAVAYRAFNGAEQWAGNTFSSARIAYVLAQNSQHVVVRADSGIERFADLQGKKFSAGIPGSGTAANIQSIFKVLGIEPEWFLGSLADGIQAIKDRRIIGIVKAGPGYELDAGIMDLNVFTPLRVLGFTPEQVTKLQAELPFIEGWITVPAGAITALPKMGEFITFQSLTLFMTTDKLPENAMYYISKALVENWKTGIVSVSSAVLKDPVKDGLSAVAGMKGLPPLHSGVSQVLQITRG